MFSVIYKIHPLARCMQAANSVCKDADIFRKPITLLKQMLYNRLSQNAESYFCIRVLFEFANILAVCWLSTHTQLCLLLVLFLFNLCNCAIPVYLIIHVGFLSGPTEINIIIIIIIIIITC